MHEKMVNRYRSMLQFISQVTRNECTDAINNILDTISNHSSKPSSNIDSSEENTSIKNSVMSEMYEITLQALKLNNNERLWFNTNLKLSRLYLEDIENKQEDLERILKDLKKSCCAPGSNLTSGTCDDKFILANLDSNKSSQLMEVFSVEIQLCAQTRNNNRMKALFPLTSQLIANTVIEPKVMAVIKEEIAKVKMTDSNWDDAYNDFYDAFRYYQEAGNSRARDCLKYVVLASMLALSHINIFAAREAKVYSDDSEIVAMSALRQSLENTDLATFEQIIANEKNNIKNEQFIMQYLQPLRARMREQVLLSLVKPYKKVNLSFLAEQLRLSVQEIIAILANLINNEQLLAEIDAINNILLIKGNTAQDSRHAKQMEIIDCLEALSCFQKQPLIEIPTM